MKVTHLERENILKAIKETVSCISEIELAYIYGSFLEGDEFHDIDIALLVSSEKSNVRELRFALRMGTAIEKAIKPRFEVDVRILNSSPIGFQYQVIKKGKLIFCRSEVTRINYEADVLSEYLDYKEVSDWLDKEFLSRI